jgi:predicted dehydrogenase
MLAYQKRREATGPGRHLGTTLPFSVPDLIPDIGFWDCAAEFAEFTNAVRQGRTPAVTGVDARRALILALASIRATPRGRSLSAAATP